MVQLGVDAAQRMAEAVHTAQALLEGQRALQRGTHHVGTRLHVGGIAEGHFDVAPGAPEAVERNAIGRWVEGGRQKGLDAVCNRIHAGGSRQTRWQAQSQVRITDGDLGNHMGREDADLAPVVQNDDGAAPYFAAGARRGGHGNDGQGGGSDLERAALDQRKLAQRACMAGRYRHRLGQVNRRAAAHGDDAVAILAAQRLDSSTHRRLRRVGRRAVEHAKTGSTQRLFDLVDDACGLHPFVGHDQRIGNTQRLAHIFQFRQHTGAKAHFGHIVDQSHNVLPVISIAIRRPEV